MSFKTAPYKTRSVGEKWELCFEFSNSADASKAYDELMALLDQVPQEHIDAQKLYRLRQANAVLAAELKSGNGWTPRLASLTEID